MEDGGNSAAFCTMRVEIAPNFIDGLADTPISKVYSGKQFNQHIDEAEEVVALKYPHAIASGGYFKLLQKCRHKNIWDVKVFSTNDDNKFITFERIDTTLLAYLTKRKDYILTSRGPCSGEITIGNRILQPVYPYAARDFTRQMRKIVRGMVKGIASLHKKRMYHGEMSLESIYIVIKNIGEIEHEEPCTKLSLPQFEGYERCKESGRGPLSEKSDWNQLGHLIEGIILSLKVSKSEYIEIKDLYDRLINGDLQSDNEILNHPSLTNFDSRSKVLMNFIDTMNPHTRYRGSTFHWTWRPHFQFILDKLPANPRVRCIYNNGYVQFLGFTRNVCCAHFGSIGSGLQADLIDDDTTLRRLRGFYPRMFLELGQVDPYNPVYP